MRQTEFTTALLGGVESQPDGRAAKQYKTQHYGAKEGRRKASTATHTWSPSLIELLEWYVSREKNTDLQTCTRCGWVYVRYLRRGRDYKHFFEPHETLCIVCSGTTKSYAWLFPDIQKIPSGECAICGTTLTGKQKETCGTECRIQYMRIYQRAAKRRERDTNKNQFNCQICGNQLTGLQRKVCSDSTCRHEYHLKYMREHMREVSRKKTTKEPKPDTVCRVCGVVMPDGKYRLSTCRKCFNKKQYASKKQKLEQTC